VVSWSRIARRIRVPLGFAFAAVYIWLAKPTAMSLLVGAAVVLPGLLLRALASGHVRKNEQLTTTGPYAYTRNPLYLGSLIVATGFAIAARSWWIAAGMIAILLAVYLPVIRAEETFLRERFPGFTDYAARVPRLFPRLTAGSAQRGEFSWRLYRRHREYNAIIGAVAMTAALVAKLLWVRS
jgi:protein-S-isoprenylcysteine O-methyltransferase Ste14